MLFLHLQLCYLLAQVGPQHVHHFHDAAGLLVLLLVVHVGVRGLPDPRGPSYSARSLLLQGRDAGVGDAALRPGFLYGAPHVLVDAVLLRELALGLVRLRVVELHELALGNLQEALRGSVGSKDLGELCVLTLPRGRGLAHLLVKLLDAARERLDAPDDFCEVVLGVGDDGLLVGDAAHGVLDLVLCPVDLGQAEGPLVVVVLLLLAEEGGEVVDLGEQRVEADLAAAQGHLQEVEPRVPAGSLAQRRQCLVPSLATGDVNLHKAHLGARERLFEELQRLVIIEDLDGLRERNHLLRLYVLVELPLSLFRITLLLQVRQELLVLRKALFGVLEVVVQRC
mmetsp:Transcript_106220/g.342685  ORF Transcript_106220/g.342685 Transcript_106220/m.342685 type:complete len:339 (-) Transcript_106220:892-1908(-)